MLETHPRLIVCDISGYGESGPYASKKAYDLLVQAEAGVLCVTGTPDVPSKVGVSIADIATGVYAFSGILTALYRREKTGKGARVEVTMLEALAEWMGYPLYYAHFSGAAPPRTGPDHATIVPTGATAAGTQEREARAETSANGVVLRQGPRPASARGGPPLQHQHQRTDGAISGALIESCPDLTADHIVPTRCAGMPTPA